MDTSPIYLDYNATTPLDKRVYEAMDPYFRDCFGNAASSGHAFGMRAKKAVEDSRRDIGLCLGAQPDEIIFTSGATESNNLALVGAIRASNKTQKHIITTAIEHKAVLDTCRYLQQYEGIRLTILDTDGEGIVAADDVASAIEEDTVVVSIIHGNNEIGTVQNIKEIGAVCKRNNVLFHTDATQTIGKIPFSVLENYSDLASLTAHKMYGPKGVGALFIQKNCSLTPIIFGGGHERGMRSGTLNVPGIVGLSTALTIATEDMDKDILHVRTLRDKLFRAFQDNCSQLRINGPDPLLKPSMRLPNNLNITLYGDEGECIAGALWNVAYSSSSACTSALGKTSHVLEAIGNVGGPHTTTMRFGIGRCTTLQEIESVVQQLLETV